MIVVGLLLGGRVHAWTLHRAPPTCSMSSSGHSGHSGHSNPNTFRHEMDMLSRFTGHDTMDAFTKNWMRQHAIRKTHVLPHTDRVRDIGFQGDGGVLSIVSTRRQWTLDLESGDLSQHRTLDPRHRYFLSPRRLYSTYFEGDHHVVACNDRPVIRTGAYPYFVRESQDEKIVMVGLCAENMRVVRLDVQGMPTASLCVDTSDVTLASASCHDMVFNGMLNGGLVVRHLGDDKDTFHLLRNPSVTIRSIDVEAIGSSVVVVVGFQDGLVKACRYDPLVDRHTMHEFSNRHVHMSPIVGLRCQGGRVVSCDDDGHVVVSDVHGAKIMYNLRASPKVEALDEETSVDISRRYLVVARGNRVNVWDHDPPHVPHHHRFHLPPGRPSAGRLR